MRSDSGGRALPERGRLGFPQFRQVVPVGKSRDQITRAHPIAFIHKNLLHDSFDLGPNIRVVKRQHSEGPGHLEFHLNIERDRRRSRRGDNSDVDARNRKGNSDNKVFDSERLADVLCGGDRRTDPNLQSH